VDVRMYKVCVIFTMHVLCRDLLQGQLKKVLDRIGQNSDRGQYHTCSVATRTKVAHCVAVEHKEITTTTTTVTASSSGTMNHNGVQHSGSQGVSGANPPKPRRPPKELIQQSRNQQPKSSGFLHSLFGI